MKNQDDLLQQGINEGRELVEKSLADGKPWYWGLFPWLQKIKLIHEHRHELSGNDAAYVEVIWRRVMAYLEARPAVAREFIEWNKNNSQE